MKTKIQLYALICAVFTVLGMSCRTQKSRPLMLQPNLENNSGILLKDSIADIIVNATKIQCSVVTPNSKDSIHTKETATLPSRLIPVFSFLMMDPSNYQTDEIVYGLFSPSVRYICEETKDRKVIVDIDFGMKKMKIHDCNGETILQSDILLTNRQLMRLTRFVFPENKMLKLLNANQ